MIQKVENKIDLLIEDAEEKRLQGDNQLETVCSALIRLLIMKNIASGDEIAKAIWEERSKVSKDTTPIENFDFSHDNDRDIYLIKTAKKIAS